MGCLDGCVQTAGEAMSPPKAVVRKIEGKGGNGER